MAESGKAIMILSIGPTRADHLQTLRGKISARVGETLERVVDELKNNGMLYSGSHSPQVSR